jgi:uncharacterized protein (TIGR02646 family)
LPGDVIENIKTSLLREQGYLCAYTLRRLSGVEDCHIEHVLPQNTAPEKDLDYGNMAGCFPKDGGNTSHGYGAPVKGGTEVELNMDFVTPHGSGCERRFRYDKKGGIQGADNAASGTIRTLKLDHGALADLRCSAIEAHGLALRQRPNRARQSLKSATAARRFAAEVLQPDNKGWLEPFCVALAQVALEYASKEEARSQRMRSQRRD